MAEEIKKAEVEVAAEEAPKKKRASKKAVKEEVKEEAPITRAPIIKDFSILKHIIATEETQRLQTEENAIVFAVAKSATKLEIKAAVQAIFNAKVKSVNTMNVPAKRRRVGRYSGFLPSYKKAIVRFDSSFDLGKIASAVATEEMQANPETDEK
ncbi:MAG: 50S ribosomal protein L23 [Candidatus Enterosoma sp.]|nr:50S ribosomal protein L23 [Candidatus Enterosoma sp.]MDY3081546.1 50S ribosomal protein L23 [Candidatus Enterosoma sp.]MDY3265814.1 50S ribosomal protein L23 [Candidatus Enterosoma sp.]